MAKATQRTQGVKAMTSGRSSGGDIKKASVSDSASPAQQFDFGGPAALGQKKAPPDSGMPAKNRS